MKPIISEYLAEWDPHGLIEFGAPKEEYSVEATEIKLAYKTNMNDDEVGNLAYTILAQRLGDFPSLKQDCMARGPELKRLLDENLRNFAEKQV